MINIGELNLVMILRLTHFHDDMTHLYSKSEVGKGGGDPKGGPPVPPTSPNGPT